MSEHLEIEYRGGILIKLGSTLVLADPVSTPPRRPDVVLVSHAHRDHYSSRTLRSLRGVPKVMSPPTRDLVDSRRLLRGVIELKPGESVEVGDLQIEAEEAGHVIGSLQFRISWRTLEVVYTGDFNLQPRVILKPARVLKADVLIMEATYGDPRYVFPPRPSIYRMLLDLVRQREESPPKLAGRTLGTAQELTALLALSRLGVTPVVHPRIGRVNYVYEKHGEFLGSYAVSEELERVERAPAIVPLGWRRMRGDVVVCTGWAVEWGGRWSAPLSSHADFEQLVEYAERSRAERVFTVYGYSRSLAEYLRREGIDATPLQA